MSGRQKYRIASSRTAQRTDNLDAMQSPLKYKTKTAAKGRMVDSARFSQVVAPRPETNQFHMASVSSVHERAARPSISIPLKTKCFSLGNAMSDSHSIIAATKTSTAHPHRITPHKQARAPFPCSAASGTRARLKFSHHKYFHPNSVLRCSHDLPASFLPRERNGAVPFLRPAAPSRKR